LLADVLMVSAAAAMLHGLQVVLASITVRRTPSG
jgi:hypothetical protein